MLKRLTRLAISLLVWSGDSLVAWVRRLFGRPLPARGVILYYHAVTAGQRAAFARQMDLLLRLAKPWRLDGETRDDSGGLHVAVTFDDGFGGVAENALPELKRRRIPCALFIPTGSWNSRPGWVKDPGHPAWGERVLSREELRVLAAEPLVTIGSHSVSHPNFLTLDSRTAAREFAGSKQALEVELGRPVDLFSFPHGAFNGPLVRQARESGYRRLFTTEPRLVNPANPGLIVGRVAAGPDDWPLEFRLKLAGAYRWQAWGRAATHIDTGKTPESPERQ
jgi:peptidoglycan/xylan/chitin deacetylase (PgdA/CDA1 family)